MGLTRNSTGKSVSEFDIDIKKENDKVIILAGNPNVGKSTVFNSLTGMRQHTGNWPGKTVSNAMGIYEYKNQRFVIVDIPGTYSLYAHSKEEEIARDLICFGEHDAVVIVCDATCIERNLNLVLQVLEITDNVIVCVNLMDEAKKKGIDINLKKLSKLLGVKVVGTTARSKKGLDELSESILHTLSKRNNKASVKVDYPEAVEKEIKYIIDFIPDCKIKKRWIALQLLEQDTDLINKINDFFKIKLSIPETKINTFENLEDITVASTFKKAEELTKVCVNYKDKNYNLRDKKIDRLLTGKLTAIPFMLLLLGVIFWITITGANIPSMYLSNFLFKIQDILLVWAKNSQVPEFIYEPLILGVYRVVAWVVSVMLPPMAIFFPFFTFLEDLGYLPRIAFNLDKTFKKCSACGKQALTMCMGFGCNAAGVVGCRIIDSPRERLIALLTNSFVPCNGKFPTLIAIISMFFTFSIGGILQSVTGALILLGIILLGVLMTFISSKLLSKTVLSGEASSFTLELPPYRTPKLGRIIVRSIFDRTLFVLGRAITSATPAGLIIWILANITVGDLTTLSHISTFLDPIGKILGLDGVILLAFLLGIPANEIVIPIIIMAYMETGVLTDYENIFFLKELLVNNGWTVITAINMMVFSLLHWPCATTIMTVYKETKSLKWTSLSVALPTVFGVLICLFTNLIFNII